VKEETAYTLQLKCDKTISILESKYEQEKQERIKIEEGKRKQADEVALIMKQNVLSKYQNIRKMVKLEKQLAALVVTQENELLIETTSCDNDSKTQQMILKQKKRID